MSLLRSVSINLVKNGVTSQKIALLKPNTLISKSKSCFLNKISYVYCLINQWIYSTGLIREMSGGHHTFQIKPARWSWNKFKDMLHFYTMVAVIPSTIVITCINIFIGPAKLVPIPEGYNPQEYEYHQVSFYCFFYIVFSLSKQACYFSAPNHPLDG